MIEVLIEIKNDVKEMREDLEKTQKCLILSTNLTNTLLLHLVGTLVVGKGKRVALNLIAHEASSTTSKKIIDILETD